MLVPADRAKIAAPRKEYIMLEKPCLTNSSKSNYVPRWSIYVVHAVTKTPEYINIPNAFRDDSFSMRSFNFNMEISPEKALHKKDMKDTVSS